MTNADIGRLVRCTDAGANENLTTGETYKFDDVRGDMIRIVDDVGRSDWYYTRRFVLADGWDFAVADELQRKARAAIDTYNEYIARMPNTLYFKLIK
ncbi:hypothetical protein [Pectobacterium phage PPWS2]|uniref:Uncharacterized protein n=1 Tax=Pectobacterium phage PPWS2 TaxID=2153295 RepID=A0A3G9EF84_9CAUD|nr:hypothetical protein HOU58_gp20 [Pectobacterium phage PPWS2]BBD74652.1 hypothetical protein [Pectobacterium phage PPWS2]